jgi:hypothetical protein
MSKTLRHLWIERKLYLIPRSSKDILSAINQVFLGHEDKNGLITFDGKKYNISHVDVFERFITGWLMGMTDGESDPILNSENCVPVELQIAQEKAPRPLKTFNHEKPQS